MTDQYYTVRLGKLHAIPHNQRKIMFACCCKCYLSDRPLWIWKGLSGQAYQHRRATTRHTNKTRSLFIIFPRGPTSSLFVFFYFWSVAADYHIKRKLLGDCVLALIESKEITVFFKSEASTSGAIFLIVRSSCPPLSQLQSLLLLLLTSSYAAWTRPQLHLWPIKSVLRYKVSNHRSPTRPLRTEDELVTLEQDASYVW